MVSFADEDQGHRGGIYQAGNWIYLGQSTWPYYRVRGKLIHPKTLHQRYGVGGQSIDWLHRNVDPNATREMRPAKHRYAMPLDKAMRRRVQRLALPYPRGSGLDGETPSVLEGGPGSTPGNRSKASSK